MTATESYAPKNLVIIYIQYEAVLCVFDTVREAEGGARDWFDGVHPIYVSDDVTDEDVFSALSLLQRSS